MRRLTGSAPPWEPTTEDERDPRHRNVGPFGPDHHDVVGGRHLDCAGRPGAVDADDLDFCSRLLVLGQASPESGRRRDTRVTAARPALDGHHHRRQANVDRSVVGFHRQVVVANRGDGMGQSGASEAHQDPVAAVHGDASHVRQVPVSSSLDLGEGLVLGRLRPELVAGAFPELAGQLVEFLVSHGFRGPGRLPSTQRRFGHDE